MNSCLAFAPAVEQTQPVRFSIDGLAVEDLFGTVYYETRELACRFQKSVRFDLIAWSELTVAADRDALASALAQAVRWCLASTNTRSVTVRAYPCCEDVWTIFDIQADLDSPGADEAEAWKPTLGTLRAAIQRMAGQWEPVTCYSDCLRVTFRLPQWITPAVTTPRGFLKAS